jgi:hypothetical protein
MTETIATRFANMLRIDPDFEEASELFAPHILVGTIDSAGQLILFADRSLFASDDINLYSTECACPECGGQFLYDLQDKLPTTVLSFITNLERTLEAS